jgi:hypothetical protein
MRMGIKLGEKLLGETQRRETVFPRRKRFISEIMPGGEKVKGSMVSRTI